LEQIGDNQYRAVMNVKVGPVQGRFEGKIQLENIVAPERYTMKVDGQGAPGFVAGEGELELLEPDSGSTLLRYGGDVSVGGRIAGVGQRLVESTAKSVTRQGLTALDQMIQARLQPPAAEAVGPDGGDVPTPVLATAVLATAGTAPTAGVLPSAPDPAARAAVPAAAAPPPAPVSMASVGAQVAKDVARDIAADYIPADKQEKVLYFSLGALAMLLFVVLVRLVQRD
jgi:carbon monoxide dehydrogenase subunit G